MSYPRTGLILVISSVLAACTVAQMAPATTAEQVFTKPVPHFPQSELTRGHEGWVIVTYTVASSGIVSDFGIKDSSGSNAFEEAALNAIREWRYEPGEQRELSVLMSFVYDRKVVRLSRRFISLNDRVHESVDNKDLVAAQEQLAKVRADEEMTAFELAYSFLAEGRIAGERGDRAGHLASFRKAMLNDGRWLARENYLSCLRAVIILELEQGDYVSAVRDYELLTETRVGRKMGADLQDFIQSARAQIEGGLFDTQPYLVADSSVSVERAWPASADLIQKPTDRGDRGATPRPIQPPTKQQ